MIIYIYRKGKEPDVTDVQVLDDIVKYSIVANRLHYLIGESWQEVDLTAYDIESVTMSKDVELVTISKDI